MDPNQFNIIHKEVQNQSRTIKEAMFIRVQDPPQLQHWQIPTTSHLGPTTTVIANIPTQTNLTMLPTSTPLLVSPHTSPPPLATQVGGILIFLTFILIGKYMHTPPPFIYIQIYSSTILVSSYIYFMYY